MSYNINMSKFDKNFTCSFCGKKKQEVEKLVVGRGQSQPTFICNYCIDTCYNAFKKPRNCIKKEKT